MTLDIGASGGTPEEADTSTQALVSIEELRRWRESNEALTAATTHLAERMEVVASRQEIDAAMEKRMATVERETAEALATNSATSQATRTRAWWLIALALLFSVLISMQLRDVVAYQCYPRLESGRTANVVLCDAVFPFSPHDFGEQTGVSTARALGGAGYIAVALGMVGVGLLYRTRFRNEGLGSARLLRTSQERERAAHEGQAEAQREQHLDQLRKVQRRRRKDDPEPDVTAQEPTAGE